MLNTQEEQRKQDFVALKIQSDSLYIKKSIEDFNRVYCRYTSAMADYDDVLIAYNLMKSNISSLLFGDL